MRSLLFDFAWVLLFPKDDTYQGKLNDLYEAHKNDANFRFTSYFRFNQELLSFLEKNQGELILNIYTSGYIQNDPVAIAQIKPLFMHIFSAKELDLPKDKPSSYLTISSKLNQKPGRITFIDDKNENISAAKAAGLNSILFENTQKLLALL